MMYSMNTSIDFYMDYLKKVKNVSDNTLQSYKRDLMAMAKYFQEQGIDDVERISETKINSYILHMENMGKSAATISRSMSAIKTFFRCMINNGMVKKEPTENLHTPDIEKKKTEAISEEMMRRIIEQIGDHDEKALRDKTMISLMVDTCIKVSELVNIKINDINLKYGYLTCHCRKKDKTIRLEEDTLNVLKNYINNAREKFVKYEETEELFLNCFGKKMSRQGIWKILKEYAGRAGVDGVSARALRR